MPIQKAGDLRWVTHSLNAAGRRMESGVRPKVISVGRNQAEGRVVCVVRATKLQDVRRLIEIALLPSARILELSERPSDGPDGASEEL